jgi:hypothetical protein
VSGNKRQNVWSLRGGEGLVWQLRLVNNACMSEIRLSEVRVNDLVNAMYLS